MKWEADDIEASQVHIASYDGQVLPDLAPYSWSIGSRLQDLLEQRRRLYRASRHTPAQSRLSARFKRSNSNSTMPYFPNYRLGTGEIWMPNLMSGYFLHRSSWPNPTTEDRLYIAWPEGPHLPGQYHGPGRYGGKYPVLSHRTGSKRAPPGGVHGGLISKEWKSWPSSGWWLGGRTLLFAAGRYAKREIK